MSNQDIYNQVASSILESLKEGAAPWFKTWNTKTPALGTHKSIVSNQTYSGVNAFITTIAAEKKEFSSSNWGTYKQWKALGRNVASHQKGTPILFFKTMEIVSNDGELKNIPMARRFYIFNEAQLEDFVPNSENHFQPIIEAQSILTNSPMCSINIMPGAPAYFIGLDLITMPALNEFKTPQYYYSSLYHEMGHASGAATRLNRKSLLEINRYGSHEYSKEELVAELTSAFLMAKAGLENIIPEASSYCAGWLKFLQNDIKHFVSAASEAQKAADYILQKERL